MDVVNIDELQPLAKEKLEPMIYDYIAGGAEDEITLFENEAAFQRIQFRPRVMVDVSQQDLSTEVLGDKVNFPILLAPTAMHCLVHEEGELATARAAAALGTIMTLSTVATYNIEEVAEATDAPKWFQLYCFKDREATKFLVQRAEAAGYKALCLTVDTPRVGRREADVRNGFHLPPGIVIKNLDTYEKFKDFPQDQQTSIVAAFINTMFENALTWGDIEWLRSITKMPILLKGVLTAEDAKLSVEHGVDGLIVSNHGGRQLDGVPATIQALPEVVEAVEGKLEVLVDGGIRRGSDVLKALALGAKAVMIGRPYVWGLALNGEAGVKRVLSILREELEVAMALAGCPTIKDIHPGIVQLTY